jgi:hypothetical protein
VDGINGYALAPALARGEEPKPARGAGRYRLASSQPLRVLEPVRLTRAPSADELAAAAALYPQTLVWNECSAGESLADFAQGEDGASYRYGVINLGADSPVDRDARFAAVYAQLGYAFETL